MGSSYKPDRVVAIAVGVVFACNVYFLGRYLVSLHTGGSIWSYFYPEWLLYIPIYVSTYLGRRSGILWLAVLKGIMVSFGLYAAYYNGLGKSWLPLDIQVVIYSNWVNTAFSIAVLVFCLLRLCRKLGPDFVPGRGLFGLWSAAPGSRPGANV